MVLPTTPPNPMSGSQILAEFSIAPSTSKRVSNDLYPLIGGTPGSICTIGAAFSGKSNVPAVTPRTNTTTNRFVLVSNTSAVVASLYSDNGSSWSISATPPAAGLWRSVACSPTGRFVTVAGGTANAAYSDDGNIWTTISPLPSIAGWFCIACSQLTGRFVAIANLSTSAAYSDDGGVTWTASSGGLPSAADWRSIACSPTTGRFVVIGTNGNSATSDDGGNTWTVRSYANINNSATGFLSCNFTGRFVLGLINQSFCIYSDDGASWNTGAGIPGTFIMSSTASDPVTGMTVVCRDVSSAGNIYRVDDGNKLSTFSGTLRVYNAIAANRIFVYTTNTGISYSSSTDPLSVTNIAYPVTSVWRGATASPGTFTTTYAAYVTTTSIIFVFTQTAGVATYSISGTGITTTTGNGPVIGVSGLSPNTSYGPFLISRTGYGNVTVPAVYTRPGIPTGRTYTSITQTGFTLNWTAPSGAGALTYTTIDNSRTLSTAVFKSGITSTSDSFTGKSPGTIYTVSVYAVNSSGQSLTDTPNAAISSTVVGERVKTLSAAPATFSVTASTTSSISLSWSAAVGVTGYDITYVDGISMLVSVGVVTSTTITGLLTTGAQYTFTITSKNESGSGGSTSTSGFTGPAAPTSFTGSVGSTDINFTWVAPSGPVTIYTLSGTGVPGSPIAITAPATSYNLTGLTGNTLYPTSGSFSLVASNNTATSDTTTAGPYTTIPNVPTSLVASAFSQTGFTISWTAPAGGASTYTITGTGTPTPTTQSGLVSTSATFTGLTAGNAYDFSVVAVGAGGTSSPGTISSVYTLPPSVTNLTNQSSGRFVAVGTSSNAATAEDGTTLTWTKRFMPSSQTWKSVCCSPITGRFVAVVRSATTTMAYSNDGITWFPAAMSTSQSHTAVTCRSTDGRFVAVNATIGAYSDDGIKWTAMTMPALSFNAVTYRPSDGMFVAVANSGYGSNSSDGITWSGYRTIDGNSNWNGVACSPITGRFVAVGKGGAASSAITVAASSDDGGVTWTTRVINSGAWNGVTCNASERFVAVSQTTNTAASSDDGINWTARTLSATSLWSAVTCYTTSGRFVAVSSSSTTAASLSTDGQTWSAQTLPSPAQVWNSVAVGPSTSTTPYVSSKTNSSITISFQAGNGATSYSISGTGLTTATGFSSPITFSGLAANTLYPTSGTFTITSINASGTGGTVSVPATTTLA